MSRSRTLMRQCMSTSPRAVHTRAPRRAAASPQRSAAAPVRKKFTDIPGPLALSMLKHSAYVLPRIGNFHHTVGLGLLDGLRERYGDLVRLFKAGRARAVLYVFDPEMMKEVYESNVTTPPYWEKSPLSLQRTNRSCPMNKENTDAIWNGIQLMLKDCSLLKNYDKVFDDIAEDLIARLEKLRQMDNALNEELESELYRWAAESLGALMLGTRLGCLEGEVYVPTPNNTHHTEEPSHKCSLARRPISELSEAERFVRLSKEIAEGGYLVRNENTLKQDSHCFNNALKAFDEHYSFTERFLNKAIAELESDKKTEQALLEKLRPLNENMLPTTADAFLAGVDPLAQTALALLYTMSLHPAQQQRAHDEQCWRRAAGGGPGGDVAGGPGGGYVAGCVRELARLQPATGGVVRRTTMPVCVAGYEVPAGVDIVLAHGVSSKDELEWGRAKAFIPERWSDEGYGSLKSTRAHPTSSMPYGERCPAAGVVDKMLISLAAKILDKYRLEWHGPAPNMVTTDVNRLEGPHYLVLQKAH